MDHFMFKLDIDDLFRSPAISSIESASTDNSGDWSDNLGDFFNNVGPEEINKMLSEEIDDCLFDSLSPQGCMLENNVEQDLQLEHLLFQNEQAIMGTANNNSSPSSSPSSSTSSLSSPSSSPCYLDPMTMMPVSELMRVPMGMLETPSSSSPVSPVPSSASLLVNNSLHESSPVLANPMMTSVARPSLGSFTTTAAGCGGGARANEARPLTPLSMQSFEASENSACEDEDFKLQQQQQQQQQYHYHPTSSSHSQLANQQLVSRVLHDDKILPTNGWQNTMNDHCYTLSPLPAVRRLGTMTNTTTTTTTNTAAQLSPKSLERLGAPPTPSDTDEEIDVVSCEKKGTLPNQPTDDEQVLYQHNFTQTFAHQTTAMTTTTTAAANQTRQGRRKRAATTPAQPPQQVQRAPRARGRPPTNGGRGRRAPANNARAAAVAAAMYAQELQASTSNVNYYQGVVAGRGAVANRGGKRNTKRLQNDAISNEKRNQHNTMERKRRIHLRGMFEELRRIVPELSHQKFAAKIKILSSSAKYCYQLQCAERNYVKHRAELGLYQLNLNSRLEKLRHEVIKVAELEELRESQARRRMLQLQHQQMLKQRMM
ncbi:uncharacterized protein LOC106642837 [Copidosoma floridanum]|uniref:uncharacterized protein LOC106642837 n=1 Tax=Copidosoma floridanum TaxID=29053 RepID=UPI0006C9931A|nr:uncharacterized protein LOC106642837 [Copidosoma floridanum]